MSFVADRGKPCPNSISNSIRASAPSLRGLSFFRRKMTEGVFIIEIIFLTPSVSLRSTAIALLLYPDFVYAAWSAAQNRPLRQQMLPLSATGGGRICCPSEGAIVGQPQGLSLRSHRLSNLAAAVSRHISANSHGGSKPLPYTMRYNSVSPTIIKFIIKILLLFSIYLYSVHNLMF